MPRGSRTRAVEDDDEKKEVASPDTTDRKKATHLRCERQRREAINSGYQDLKDLLPSSLSNLGCKTTNASILFRACDYAKQLLAEREATEEELNRLKSQQAALEIIAQQYEELSCDDLSSVSTSATGNATSPTQIKLKMFRTLMDAWFESFDVQVDASDYSTLAKTLLRWLEQTNFEEGTNIMLTAADARGS